MRDMFILNTEGAWLWLRTMKWRNRVKAWESFLEGLYHKCVLVPNRPVDWKEKYRRKRKERYGGKP